MSAERDPGAYRQELLKQQEAQRLIAQARARTSPPPACRGQAFFGYVCFQGHVAYNIAVKGMQPASALVAAKASGYQPTSIGWKMLEKTANDIYQALQAETELGAGHVTPAVDVLPMVPAPEEKPGVPTWVWVVGGGAALLAVMAYMRKKK